MKGFLKAFFAALLALVVFCIIVFFFMVGMVSSAMQTKEPAKVHSPSVLVLNLDKPLREQSYLNPLNAVLRNGDMKIQGLHELTRAIRKAKSDFDVKGLYLKLNGDSNGYATNEELRRALLDFKKSGKFVVAYGDVISQKDYYIGSIADKVFLNQEGALDFNGFSMQMLFFKGAMDKLGIKAQVFFDGKYKSATEPFRVTEMTDANREQTTEYLGNLYQNFLQDISLERHIDTSTLFQYANEGLIQSADNALKYGLVDGLKYKDEVMQVIQEKMGLSGDEKPNLVAFSDYSATVSSFSAKGGDKIAILYAQGDIVNGEGRAEGATPQIAADRYIKLFKQLRTDKSVKAIVFRVNSPGGSALASDKIWRAVMLTKQIKPVVVSMGDYAASGGYYISCAADSIFTERNTLTGSIGVFGIIPNLQSFLKNKLGITSDGIKTAQYADMGSPLRPLTDAEKKMIQDGVNRIYDTFKHRVSKGRNLPEAMVDSIAQGHVWSGQDAIKIGLADRIGGMQSAILCAKHMANLSSYALDEYPKPTTPYKEVLNNLTGRIQASIVQRELGAQYPVFQQFRTLSASEGQVMARLPYVLYNH